MSLKEQVPNVYHVGTRNVGSYRVSGIPHITTATISNGGETSVSFQSVTKDIKITKNTTGGSLRVHFASKGSGHTMKALATRDSDGDNVPDQLFRVLKNFTAPFSFNMWFKPQANLPVYTQLSLWEQTHHPLMNAKVQYQPSQFNINTAIKDNTGAVLGAGGLNHRLALTDYDTTAWHSYTLAVDLIGGAHYLDGNNIGLGGGVAEASFLPGRSFSTDMRGIFFPRRFSPLMEVTNLTIWGKRLTSTEANELFNNGNFLDPRSHSAAADLQHWYRMDDTLTPPDTNTQVFDRIGNLNADVPNQIPGKINQSNVSAEYVTGPPGWVSGSANSPNTITGGHYLTLTDSSPSITLNCSCKEIYLSATGGNQTASVMANLTNISSAGIPDLTGAGIDE